MFSRELTTLKLSQSQVPFQLAAELKSMGKLAWPTGPSMTRWTLVSQQADWEPQVADPAGWGLCQFPCCGAGWQIHWEFRRKPEMAIFQFPHLYHSETSAYFSHHLCNQLIFSLQYSFKNGIESKPIRIYISGSLRIHGTSLEEFFYYYFRAPHCEWLRVPLNHLPLIQQCTV